MRKIVIAYLLSSYFYSLSAQEIVKSDDLSFWKPTKTNWQIVGDVTADLMKDDAMTVTKGTGVLANMPTEAIKGNLISVAEYGDADVTFDFMMAKHSNSGFYLQGRYEVQLLDSWGVKNPNFGDCGGIYKRRKLPSGELFDGSAPRINACLAPGLWQHLEISFQAPRFDAAGKKTTNAKILNVTLNGFTVQENVELTGPTGGPISEQEAATGPFMIQGDHGPVAFRNLKVTPLGGAPATLTGINFKTSYGQFYNAKDFFSKKPDTSGVIDQLTWATSSKINEFAQYYTGTFNAPKAGNYTFATQISGHNFLKINGIEVEPLKWTTGGDQRTGTVSLPAGAATFEVGMNHQDNWMPPALGVWVEGPGFRKTALHNFTSMLAGTPNDPILLDAREPKVFRAFMDFKTDRQQKRITHGAHVGSPDNLHYTYDMDNGALAQIWKGDFLNTSPMWDNRGDGSARARGVVLALADMPLFVTESSKNTMTDAMPTDAQFKAMGYDLDDNNLPTFRYKAFGAMIEDAIRIKDGKYLTRTLSVKNVTAIPLFSRLAIGKNITKIDNNTYSIDGKSYFIQLPTGITAMVQKSGTDDVLIVPVKDKLEYSIMW
jgi:Domain of Unknown Function (DUF1080)